MRRGFCTSDADGAGEPFAYCSFPLNAAGGRAHHDAQIFARCLDVEVLRAQGGVSTVHLVAGSKAQAKAIFALAEGDTSAVCLLAWSGMDDELLWASLADAALGADWVPVAEWVDGEVGVRALLVRPKHASFHSRLSLLSGAPWAMLAGAAFMILLADLDSEEAFEVIDMNTLALLFGASLLSANLEACQIQQQLIESLVKDSAPKMIVKLSLMAMVMSWIITNDGSSLIISPVALRALRRRPELPKLPIMLAVSSSANIGSALLLSGNPQNILVDEFSRESGLTFGGYMVWALVPTALSMILNTVMLLFFLKKGYPMFCCCTREKKIDGD